MSRKNKVFLIVAVVISVAALVFSSLMLWTGINGPYQNAKQNLTQDWPNSVMYEVFVRSFYDSNGDRIGDFNGLTEKLDYLSDLGVEGIWLMPINPSPSYHKYDVTDYYAIDPEYGTMDDFKHFLEEAHSRNIKVIMDLVVNHTSVEHPWFKDALSSKESPYRDWYVWGNENTNILERGEWNQQVWHGAGDNRYYGLFWQGMPDLNFDHPEVRKEMTEVAKYWLDLGVDGFRLDAAKHIYSKNENKNVEWWQEFRKELEAKKPNLFLVGEVWAPASEVAPYLQDGLHSAFNFDLSQKIVDSAKQEGDSGIVSYLTRIREYYATKSNDFIDSTFITNHDMDRVMSVLNGDMNHAKMAASLLFTLPGTPFIYYGEEIGMEGKKPDEQIREPMLWYNDPTGTGQTKWERARYNINEKAISVEEQLAKSDSLYNHYKSMIYLRRSNPVLLSGDIKSIALREKGIIGFKRTLPDQEMVVLHNMTGEDKAFALKKELVNFTDVLFENGLKKIKANNEQLTIQIAPYSTVVIAPNK